MVELFNSPLFYTIIILFSMLSLVNFFIACYQIIKSIKEDTKKLKSIANFCLYLEILSNLLNFILLAVARINSSFTIPAIVLEYIIVISWEATLISSLIINLFWKDLLKKSSINKVKKIGQIISKYRIIIFIHVALSLLIFISEY